MPLTPGQVVQNRYRVVRLLGQGGMGAVYRAWDLTLNVPVALKEMVPQPGIDPSTLAQLRAQFHQEARALAGLSHPHLPRVTDFFDWGGRSFLAMDFIEGTSLDQLVLRHGPLPQAQVVRWGLQLLDALAYCHARRILHRDIKPQNIIIASDGRAVLVDFGLVKLWDPRQPVTQHIVRGMGTPEYASPEHFHLGGFHTDPRSDLYSLGATLYFALTGREPPSALDRWASGAPLPPLQGPGISPRVAAVIRQAMELDIRRRFADARQMQVALQQAARVSPHPLAWPQSAWVSPFSSGGIGTRPRPVPLPRDARWPLEMATAMAMALVGVLVIQVLLFAPWMTVGLYFGRSLSALLLGALGWFIGDLIFQVLARPESAAAPAASRRPTQRLAAFTRGLARRLTLGQQVVLLGGLLALVILLAWVLAPIVARMPFLINFVSFYAPIAPLVYAAVGRRPGWAGLAHFLTLTLGAAAAWMRTPADTGLGSLALAALLGALLMEGLAFLAERTVIE
ncbi:MAG: serine/threonine protein kinase [Anaerolineae bacterium]|nr:serine/threonine protein kinase [Anaerolineae bacterium]